MPIQTDPPEALKFPCRFPIKAMGRQDDGLVDTVRDIVARHVRRPEDMTVKWRHSRQGNYISVTVTFTAHSRAQLDDLYRELSGHPHILVVL